MKTSLFGTLLATTLVMLQGCDLASSGHSGLTSQNSAKSSGIKPVKVSTVESVTRQVLLSINATGDFIADEISDIASEVEGQVVATPVGVGDFVKKGAVIARLDNRTAKLRLQQAIAQERQAEASLNLEKGKLGIARAGGEKTRGQSESSALQTDGTRRNDDTAKDSNHLGQHGIAAAEAALEGARAQTALARKALNDTIIKAPFDGYIIDRPAAPGEHVTPSIKIATLQRINPIKLRLRIPEADAGLAQVGGAVIATVVPYPQRQFSGGVTSINPVVDTASRTIIIEVRIENPDSLLLPGMFAAAQLNQPAGEEAFFVPSQAVIKDPETNLSHVYVLDGDIARVRAVQTIEQVGLIENGMIRITSGLSGAEKVITDNLNLLFDGAKIIF